MGRGAAFVCVVREVEHTELSQGYCAELGPPADHETLRPARENTSWADAVEAAEPEVVWGQLTQKRLGLTTTPETGTAGGRGFRGQQRPRRARPTTVSF